MRIGILFKKTYIWLNKMNIIGWNVKWSRNSEFRLRVFKTFEWKIKNNENDHTLLMFSIRFGSIIAKYISQPAQSQTYNLWIKLRNIFFSRMQFCIRSVENEKGNFRLHHIYIYSIYSIYLYDYIYYILEYKCIISIQSRCSIIHTRAKS